MKKKIVSLLSCLCVGLIATAVGVVNINEAAAEETSGEPAIFAMQAGASVRVDDDATQSGIRWSAVINETYWNSFKIENEITEETKVAFGSFVAPVGNIDGELSKNTSEVKLVECKDSLGNVISTPAFDADGLFTFYSTILYNDSQLIGIEKAAYATELVARSYIRVGEGETASYTPVDSMYREVKTEEGTVNEYGYAYENSLVTRSMQAVALAATQAGTATETQVGKYYGSTVTTSEENSGYYSEADKAGSLTAAHAGVTSKFKAYVGALPVTVSAAGETLTISGFTGLKAGETYHLNLFSPEGKAYSQPFVYATKVIDDKQDLSYFTISDITIKADAAGYVESATAFEGYYVLSQDIDASGYTHQVVSGTARDNMKGLTHVGLYAQNGGLKGVFDGNGHTISNLTVGHHGLFGLIYGGTVKNVGFTNVTLKGDTNLENLSFLAEQMIDGTIENVYIQANEIIGGNGTTASNQSRGNRALLAIVAYGKTTIKNSVFNYNIEGTQKEYARSYGLIAYEHKARWNERYPAGSSVTFENVYVISNAMISSWNTAGIYNKNSSVTIAENEVDVAGLTNDQRKEVCQAYVYEKLGGAGNTNITETTITGDRIYRYTGMYRYDTLQDMQAANNDYSGFNTKNWDISDGVLSWK